MLRVDILAKIAVISFLFFMAWTVLLSIFALWTDRVLERGPTEIDFLFMYMGLVGAVTQFVVTGPLAKKIGEMRILQLTAAGLLLGFLGLTFTDSIVLILICLKVLSAANSLFTPGRRVSCRKTRRRKSVAPSLEFFNRLAAWAGSRVRRSRA